MRTACASPQRANDGLGWLDVQRAVNSGICDLAARWTAQDEIFAFLCECGDPQCVETVPLLPWAYAEARCKNEVVSRAHAARMAQDTESPR